MRTMLTIAAMLMLAVPAAARPAAHRAVKSPRVASAAAVAALRPAFEFAFPVYAMMSARAATLAKAQAAGVDGINRLFVRATLADASSREITTPNNDTLYAGAWLDLRGGPVALEMPRTARYHSAALIDLFTDVVATAGTRTGDAEHYLIVGPQWRGSVDPSVRLLRSDTDDAWLLVRMLVDGPNDLPAATRELRRVSLDASAAHAIPTQAVPTGAVDSANFLEVTNEALGRNPLPPRGARFGAVGIRPGTASVFAQLPAAVRAQWTAALPRLRAELAGGVTGTGTVVDGWSYASANIARFGDDDASRARVALGGLGALPREEAVYISAACDAAGAPLDGRRAYVAHIPAHLPVGAFWSLTMYRVEADGKLFLVDNPLGRFALGDRSASLHAERDGGFDIFVQPVAPSGERVVNWLPTPAGPFRLVFRGYLPTGALLDGSFRLPPVVAADPVP